MLKNGMKKRVIKVAELFAGVGGFRLGLEGWNGMSPTSNYTQPIAQPPDYSFEVIWSNQWEPSSKRQHANEVYEDCWSSESHNGCDIATIKTALIPDHDMLVGGFPCQDYSVTTTLKNSKGLRGKKGVLWWEIERILREKGSRAPKYLLLENVDRLLKSPSNQRGRDFAIMLSSLSDLGYAVEWRVINAGDYGMPQRRRRVFILGYMEGTLEYQRIKAQEEKTDWLNSGVLGAAFPVKSVESSSINTGLLKGDLSRLSKGFNARKKKALSPFGTAGIMLAREYWTTRVTPDYEGRYSTLGDVLQPLRQVPQEFRVSKESLEKWRKCKEAKRIPKINKTYGYSYIFSEGAIAFPDALDKPSRTIITGEGGATATRTKHLIKQGRTWRRLTPIELERLNMFPDNHTKCADISHIRRAFFMGNALVVGVIERIGTALLESMAEGENVVNRPKKGKKVEPST